MSIFPQFTFGAPVSMAPTGLALNSYMWVNTNDQVEFIFQVPDDRNNATITITKLGYRLTSVTGTSPQMKISLQGVDGSGNPDGTIKGGATPASATFTPSGSNTWNWVTLDNAYTANRGDFLAIVIAYNSGTLNGSNTPSIGAAIQIGEARGWPYAIQNVAGVRTRFTSTPWFGFASASRTFGFPIQALTSTQYSSTNERALRFTLDPTWVTTYQVAGCRVQMITPAAGKTVKVILYSGTTAIATATWDSDYIVAAGVTREVPFWFQDATLPTLQAGQEYRIGIQPQDAATNIALFQLDVASASDLDSLPGGQSWYLSTRASGGATAWTDTLTSRPIAELIISNWTPAPGFIWRPAMTGNVGG